MQSTTNLSLSSNKEKIIESIENEYKIISTSFTNLSKYYSELIASTAFNSKNSLETNSIPTSYPIKQISNPKSIYGDIPTTEMNLKEVLLSGNNQIKSINNQKRKVARKKIAHGRVFSTDTFENGEKGIGFKVCIQYLQITSVFGPFKNFDLANLLKNNVLEELSKLDPKKEDITLIAKKHLEDFKTQIHAQFPPPETCKDIRLKLANNKKAK